ncbi:SUMF1/EgtB/PvdO family nonheme iron enzyme [Azospirillum griseum]
MATLTSYHPEPRRIKIKKDRPRAKLPASSEAHSSQALPLQEVVERPLAALPVWQPTARTVIHPAAERPPSPPPLPEPDMGDPATAADLAPWNAVLPRLRAAAAAWAAGKAADEAALLRLVAKGALLDHLPRRQRRRWGSAVQIISDRAERLTPFYEDQARLEERLNSLFPSHGLQRGTAFDGLDDPVLANQRGGPASYRLPPPGTLVLVLGDLGCLAGDPERLVARWIAFGRRLAAAGCRAVAVTPCPRARWHPGLSRWWTMVEWERGAASPADSAALALRTERLLALASPAIRLEPALLRDLRWLLGPAADAGTEADLWQHRALMGRSGVAATLDPAVAAERRAAFFQEDAKTIERALTTLRRHRAGSAKLIWLEELLRLDPAKLPADLRNHDLPWAQRHLVELAPTLANRSRGLAWARRLFLRQSADGEVVGDLAVRAALSRMYVEAFPDNEQRPSPPPCFDTALLDSHGLPDGSVEVRQIGSDLVLQPSGAGRGSLLTTLRTANGEIQLIEGEDDRNVFWKTGVPPSWALDWGWDEFGAWTSFGIDGVVQRLRWIPPGRFLMGSPDDEPGRDDDEGPQHKVTLSRGYWLFDTACPQALWRAVMGENPSRFEGDDRHPVDSVSWHDVQGFLTRLNARVPGLALTLPTEAQWEHACRAGTTTPFSFGATVTPEQVNYDGNHPYADGPKGLYRKSTVPVGSLPPNAWGLYEMHGNVLEWCADGLRDYSTEAATDPRGPESADAERVLRGGSWNVGARDARAACRFWSLPDVRFYTIGFRCARVQASPEDAAEPTAPALPRLAERRGTQGSAGGAVLRVTSGTGVGARCPWPEAPVVRIRTDREELRVDRITRPGWADALGRDRFGLWTEIVVEPEGGGESVTQRLRWIPPGRFLMGSPEDEPERYGDEGPQHAVTLSRGYWLFDTTCTQALWRAVMGANPSGFWGDGRRPVERVSWNDVQGFLTRLNGRVPGLDLCLPTEAQWEHACRAGTTTPFSFGVTITPEQVNYDGNSPYADGPKELYRKSTVSVGSLPPNAWGLYEMHGNLWEWCADGKRTYSAEPATDPRGPENAVARRVLRGGSWGNDARLARAACRYWFPPDDRSADFGFRCARVQA